MKREPFCIKSENCPMCPIRSECDMVNRAWVINNFRNHPEKHSYGFGNIHVESLPQ